MKNKKKTKVYECVKSSSKSKCKTQQTQTFNQRAFKREGGGERARERERERKLKRAVREREREERSFCLKGGWVVLHEPERTIFLREGGLCYMNQRGPYDYKLF